MKGAHTVEEMAFYPSNGSSGHSFTPKENRSDEEFMVKLRAIIELLKVEGYVKLSPISILEAMGLVSEAIFELNRIRRQFHERKA
jgi:hypothetical protein